MAQALVVPSGPGVPPFKRASELIDQQGINIVIFGYGGAGKTTLGCTAQDSDLGKDVLLIDLEGGVRSVADRDDITVMQPRNWEEVVQLIEWLKKNDHPYKTWIFDSLTEAQRMTLKMVMKSSPTPDMPSQPEYGKSNELVLTMVRELRNLSVERGLNIVFTAHADEVKDESSGTVLIRMALTPGCVKGLYQIVDAIAYLQADYKTDQRKLFLKSTHRVLAKFRQPRTGPQLPTEIENPSMAAIIEHVRAAKREDNKKEG